MNDRKKVMISSSELTEKSITSKVFWSKTIANTDFCAHDIFHRLLKQHRKHRRFYKLNLSKKR